jgi:hypothetical protein
MTIISPEEIAIRKITANPEQYIAAFNILIRTWIKANIRRIDRRDMLSICDELLAYEMPAEFMVWYFHKHANSKFNSFNMFREQHGNKIKATAVIQQSHLPATTGTAYREDMRTIAAADAFRPNSNGSNGGRKKRTQYRRRMRMRTRRHRTRNRNPRK